MLSALKELYYIIHILIQEQNILKISSLFSLNYICNLFPFLCYNLVILQHNYFLSFFLPAKLLFKCLNLSVFHLSVLLSFCNAWVDNFHELSIIYLLISSFSIHLSLSHLPFTLPIQSSHISFTYFFLFLCLSFPSSSLAPQYPLLFFAFVLFPYFNFCNVFMKIIRKENINEINSLICTIWRNYLFIFLLHYYHVNVCPIVRQYQNHHIFFFFLQFFNFVFLTFFHFIFFL